MMSLGCHRHVEHRWCRQQAEPYDAACLWGLFGLNRATRVEGADVGRP